MHVNLSHYLDTLRCILPRELLLQQAHRHLMDLCPVCRGEWDGRPHFHPAPATDGGSLEKPDLAARPIPSKRDFSLTLYEQEHARLSRMRAIARRAREDVARLRRLPPARWPATVARSKTRFRSRAFVLLLLDESKRAVRTAPHEAAAFAALVPLALDQRKGREALAWARELRALAAAHHANAVRIEGDLPGADRDFAALRTELRRTSPASADTEAEIASLEASLRIDQRRFDDAERLLAGAARGAERLAGRIFVQHANLLMTLGQAEHALDRFERAAATLDPASEPHLHLCVVTGRVNCLCDLDRYREADRLLTSKRPDLVDKGDSQTAAFYTFYRSRVDLGLGRLKAAERGFSDARDKLIALGRNYDAIQANLFLADALLAAGKVAELRDLAADLVPLFKARGVEREALASLRLLAQAVQAETVTAALLSELRQSLATGSHGAGPLAPG